MAERAKGGSNTPAQPPKEMSMEVRLLLAFLLMGAVMFLTPYFFKSQIPPPGKKDVAGQTASEGTPGAPSIPGGNPATDTAAPPAAGVEKVSAAAVFPAGATPQKAEPPFLIDTDLYNITFGSPGATFRRCHSKQPMF